MAKALSELGIKRAAVVHGRPGIDEVSPISTTDVIIIDNGELKRTVLDVRDFGVTPLQSLEPLRVKDVNESKEKVLKALQGKGPEALFLSLNAALALHVMEVLDVSEAYQRIIEFIHTHDTIEALRKIVEASGGEPTF
jgi:anthranilate phosphoribosyltransferase